MLTRTRALLLSTALTLSLSTLALSQGRPSHLPDPRLTPGHTVAVTKDDVCGSGREALDDKISIKVKSQVFDLYSIGSDTPGSYNVDHLVPASLGGSNKLENLWPQPLSGEWSYLLKNRLEKRLYKMVCGGELDLKEAQDAIARDWVSAYKRYVGEAK
ncbi:MAG TPA: HNH endonuclease [Blastocatellia bacterium]|nr:HNH endonuclease [Blastocatellia bacterium]